METKALINMLFLCVISWTSCQQETNQFEVKVTGLENYNGQTAYLYKEMFVHMDSTRVLLDSAIITDGTLQFKGEADTLHFYSMRPKQPNQLYVFGDFCPEPGKLNLKAETTPYKAHFDFISSTSRRSLNKIYMIDRFELGDSTYRKLHRLMEANIQNAVGSALFAFCNIRPDEVDSLYHKTDKALISGNYWLQLLEKMVQTTRPIHIGEPFIDFKQQIYQGDTLQFSDITGKGKPTCLVFLQNQSCQSKIMQQLNIWKERYQDIEYVYVLSFPDLNPFPRLTEQLRGLVLYDNPLDDSQSVKWTYRVFLQRNSVAYLFDQKGTLKETKEFDYETTKAPLISPVDLR